MSRLAGGKPFTGLVPVERSMHVVELDSGLGHQERRCTLHSATVRSDATPCRPMWKTSRCRILSDDPLPMFTDRAVHGVRGEVQIARPGHRAQNEPSLPEHLLVTQSGEHTGAG